MKISRRKGCWTSYIYKVYWKWEKKMIGEHLMKWKKWKNEKEEFFASFLRVKKPQDSLKLYIYFFWIYEIGRANIYLTILLFDFYCLFND